MKSRVGGEFDYALYGAMFCIGKTRIEVLISHQAAQHEIGFVAGPGRTDADRTTTAKLCQCCSEFFARERARLAVKQSHRLLQSLLAIDVVEAKTATVAKKITIDFTVITIHQPTQGTVAFSRRGITTYGTANTDRRSALQVPFSGVVFAETLVGEYAGGTDLHQVAAELTLQHAVGLPAKIHVVM